MPPHAQCNELHKLQACPLCHLFDAQDEAIAKMNVDKLRKLKPFFRPQGGTITGGCGACFWRTAHTLVGTCAPTAMPCRDPPQRLHHPSRPPPPPPRLLAAGNASPISDGAAAVVLASASAVRQYRLPVLGRILGFGDAAVDPRDFPTAPTVAVPKALEHAGGWVGGGDSAHAVPSRRAEQRAGGLWGGVADSPACTQGHPPFLRCLPQGSVAGRWTTGR